MEPMLADADHLARTLASLLCLCRKRGEIGHSPPVSPEQHHEKSSSSDAVTFPEEMILGAIPVILSEAYSSASKLPQSKALKSKRVLELTPISELRSNGE